MRDQGTSMDAGFGISDDSDCSRGEKRLPAFRGRLMVRRQRRRNLRRRAADQDRDLALKIEAGKIVEVVFRNAQAVTHKHQRGFHFRSKVHARAEDRIFSQGQRLRFAIAKQRSARLLLHQLPRHKFHWLVVALDARGLKACALQLADHVGLCLFQPWASRVAAFHVVRGQDLYVLPPRFPVECGRIALLRERRNQENSDP